MPIPPLGQAPGGTGGIGADFTAGGMLVNTGTIIGGTGGSGRTRGAGGAGVDLSSGGTLTNAGTIMGGTGGIGTFGGVGVFLNGGTLIDSGTVAGGAGGSPRGSPGAAVQFGTAAATLVVNPGAVFNGQVVANASATDVLALGGTTAGTLTGLGTSFVNFSSIAVSQGANWALSGANTLAAGTALSIGAAGTLKNSGSLNVSGNLGATGAGSLVNNGTVAMVSTGTADIGTAFINSAAVSVNSGKMEFLTPVGGTGTVAVEGGATAKFSKGAAATQSVSFPSLPHTAVAELDLDKPSTFLGTIINFGSLDQIDLLNTTATTLSYSGGKLAVQNGSTTVANLSITGSYTTKSFALGSAGHGDALITFKS